MIHVGDALETLRMFPEDFFRCCVTSPPYWGLRDYGCEGQIGLEQSPDAYVARLVDVFREVRRCLTPDGTLWLNLGDTYAQSGRGGACFETTTLEGGLRNHNASRADKVRRAKLPEGFKRKDIVGTPWMVAFALRADGWYLRQEIIWHKPNPMPTSVRDRFTSSHEQLFLFSRSQHYYFNHEEAQEPVAESTKKDKRIGTVRVPDYKKAEENYGKGTSASSLCARNAVGNGETRNRRDVWTISGKPFKGAHFATFPHDLVDPCVRIGSAPGDNVLDPFAGAGTVGLVCKRLGREHEGIELNPEYARMATERIAQG